MSRAENREGRLPPESLDAVEAEAWAFLEAGGRSFRAPFHSGVIGTLGAEGPSTRVVILRGADGPRRRVWCHTDTRSPKFAEIRADPRVAWTLYDEPSRLQFRLWGRASLHHDDALADERWAATAMNSRKIYQAVVAPGTVSPVPTTGHPPELDDERWTLEFSERGRPNFAVVETVVTRLEALYLHHAGHRRIGIHYGVDGQRLSADWLVP